VRKTYRASDAELNRVESMVIGKKCYSVSELKRWALESLLTKPMQRRLSLLSKTWKYWRLFCLSIPSPFSFCYAEININLDQLMEGWCSRLLPRDGGLLFQNRK